MDKKQAKEYMEKGYLCISTLFEIIGNPKEHVEKSMNLVIEAIKKNDAVKVVKEEFGKPEQTPDKLWGVYCEAEFLVKDLRTLGWITLNFAPASVEVKEPGKITVRDKELTDMLGDMLSQIHVTNTKIIEAQGTTKNLLLNINALIRNTILLAITLDKHTPADIAKTIGVKAKDIEPVLDAMIKEGKLVKKGNKYLRK